MAISKDEIKMCKDMGINVHDYVKGIKVAEDRAKGIKAFNRMENRSRKRNSKLLHSLFKNGR